MLVLAALCGTVLLLPGWRGVLVETPHDDVLAAAREAVPDRVFGVTRPAELDGGRDGGEWHAQYHGSLAARLLRGAGMGASLTRIVPPAFAAHVPPRAERADGYFRIETALHWPWWRPGGGVDWHDPRVPRLAEER
jgi:hypothetical protein